MVNKPQDCPLLLPLISPALPAVAHISTGGSSACLDSCLPTRLLLFFNILCFCFNFHLFCFFLLVFNLLCFCFCIEIKCFNFNLYCFFAFLLFLNRPSGSMIVFGSPLKQSGFLFSSQLNREYLSRLLAVNLKSTQRSVSWFCLFSVVTFCLRVKVPSISQPSFWHHS